MHVYLEFDTKDLDEMPELVADELVQWQAERAEHVELIDNRSEIAATDAGFSLSAWRLGLGLEIRDKKHLKEPLNFLYGLAKTYQLEVVVGIYHALSHSKEDICYFGFEEGRPDLFEIGCYLGL